MSFDPINMPYNTYGAPMVPTGTLPPNFTNQQQQYNQQQQMMINPAALETPTIVTGGSNNSGFKPRFTIQREDGTKANPIPVDRDISDAEVEAATKARSNRRKETTSGAIVRSGDTEKVNGVVEDTATIYSYAESTNMLHETLGQIDSINRELMEEFAAIKRNRTLKNKYNVLNGLSENIGNLISNRIQVIKELNSTISKANDMDYKKDKDRRAAMANVDDDKYIADLYKSFMQNPTMNMPAPQLPQVDPALFGSGIVRADIGGVAPAGGAPVETSYLSYLSNLTPEQNLMRYESNPNVKQVVVFDAASGNRFFQMMDMATGNVIPNVPIYDPMFLEDTTLDLKNKIAKNINLNETFPIVVINEGVTQQY